MMQPMINKLVTSSNLYLLTQLHILEGKGVGFCVSKDWCLCRVKVNYNSSVKGLRYFHLVSPFSLVNFFFIRDLVTRLRSDRQDRFCRGCGSTLPQFDCEYNFQL